MELCLSDFAQTAEKNWAVKQSQNKKHWAITGDFFELAGLVCGVIIDKKFIAFNITAFEKDLDAFCITCENQDLQMRVVLTPENDFLSITPSLKNISSKKIFVENAVFAAIDDGGRLSLGDDPKNYRVLINGFDSWNKTGTRPYLKDLRNKPLGDIRFSREVTSHIVTAVWSKETKHTLFIGAKRDHAYPSTYNLVSFNDENKEGLSIERQINHSLMPGQQINFEDFQLHQCLDLAAMLENFAKDNFAPVDTSDKFNVAWSTWDYYLNNPSFNDVLENMKMINSNPVLKEKVDVISVDAGWFNITGDWRANIDFFSDRAAMAKNIISEGFIPGIWLMPLVVSPGAKITRYNVDWFIKDENGDHFNLNYGDQLWGDAIFCLDFTVPEVKDYIFNLFRQMYLEGYRYFKLDFLRIYLRHPKYELFDKNVNRAQMLRSCLETIRDAVGDDSAICACGAPLEIVQGVVDFVRTSDDVKHYWSNYQRTARSIGNRYWTHKNLFNADPDFFIIRGKDTADLTGSPWILPFPKVHEPFRWISGTPATYNEAQVAATVQLISSGPLVLGDRLKMLNQKGLGLIEKVLNNIKNTKFTALDIMDANTTCVWARCDDSGEYDMFAIFNWYDEPITLDCSQWMQSRIWHDFWEDKNVNLNTQAITIAPRSVKVYDIK